MVPAVLLALPGSALAAAPVACFTQSPASNVLTSTTVTLNSSCTTDRDNDIAGRAWDLDNDGQFDDGTATTVTKSWPTPGIYTVRLGVADKKGATNVATQTVTVQNRAPVAALNFAPAAPVSGQAITFSSASTDPDGSVAKVEWDLDGDSVVDWNDGTGASVSKAYAAPGTYLVRIRATDNNGTTAIGTKSVTVANRAPVAGFTVAPAQPVEGDAVTLTSTASDPDGKVASQAWDLDNDGSFDDGTAATATWTPPAAGAFTVHLRVVDDKNAPAEASKTITVDARPAPPGDPALPESRSDAGQAFDVSAPVGAPPQPTQPETPVTAPVTPLRWLNPFPTVRMRGRTTRRGVQLNLLTVRAPYGARAEVRCKGRGCPAKLQSKKIKTRSKRGSATVHFSRLERFLPAGVQLEVAVTRKGMVGKYTSIKIRKLALPVRSDRCLLPDSKTPSACPATP